MAYKRSRKYTKRRSKNPRKRRTYRQMVSTRSPIAQKMITKFKYFDQIDINPPASGVAVQRISSNGLYDPDVTGAGHQPRGFDQLMALYDHYVVLGAKLKVTYDNSANAPIICGITLKDSILTSSDVIDYAESSRTVSKVISGTNGPAHGTLSMKVNPNKFLGRSKPLADPELKGSTVANPTEGCFFHIWAANTDGLTDPGVVHCQVHVEYVVALIEPKTPGMS